MVDDPFRFSTMLEVRWRDLDPMGHVNNAVYFSYLEQARVHYLRELGAIPSELPVQVAVGTGRACDNPHAGERDAQL